jgi:hypothetical protein
MIRDHSRIEELLAVQALGGLDGDDLDTLARERAGHGDCRECRRLEDGFAETAGRLAFTLEPGIVDSSMPDRILASSEDEVAMPSDEVAAHAQRRRPAWQSLVAIAAVFALLLVAGSVLARGGTTSIASVSSEQRIARFQGTSQADLVMAYTPGQPGGVIWGSELPDPGPGNVYEIWMIQGGQAVSGGCVTPHDGALALRLEGSVGTSEAMAVTVESSECPAAPTTEPILSAELPPAI